MNVACRFAQHSVRLGQRASWQTVATPLSATTRLVREKSPEGSGLLSQGGSRRVDDVRGEDDNTFSSKAVALPE